MTNSPADDLELEDSVAEEEELKDLEFKRLLSNLPQDGDAYVKLYRKPDPIPGKSSPKLEFLHVFEDPFQITDIEISIKELAEKNGWENGTYQIRAFSRSRRGFLSKPFDVVISGLKEKLEQSTNGSPDPEKYQEAVEKGIRFAEKTNETIKKEVSVAQQQTQSVTDKLMDVILKRVENPPVSQKSSIEELSSAVKAVKELLPPLPTVAPSSETAFLKELLPLVVAALKPEKKEDFFESLVKFKKLEELFGGGKKESELDSIKKVMDIISAVSGLVPGAGSAEKSIGQVLAEQLIPILPDVIGKVTGTIHEVIQYKLATLPPGGIPRPFVVPPPAIPSLPTQPLSQEKDEMLAYLNLSRDVRKVCETLNPENYPRILQAIYHHLPNGEEFVKEFLSGMLTREQVIDYLAIADVSFRTNVQFRNYIFGFLDWAKRTLQESVPPESSVEEPVLLPGQVVGACVACKSEYLYNSREDFDLDARICDAKENEQSASCGGEVVFKALVESQVDESIHSNFSGELNGGEKTFEESPKPLEDRSIEPGTEV